MEQGVPISVYGYVSSVMHNLREKYAHVHSAHPLSWWVSYTLANMPVRCNGRKNCTLVNIRHMNVLYFNTMAHHVANYLSSHSRWWWMQYPRDRNAFNVVKNGLVTVRHTCHCLAQGNVLNFENKSHRPWTTRQPQDI